MEFQVDSSQLIVPGLAPFYRRLAPYAYTLMRCATGAILAPHGIQKILQSPISRYSETIAAAGLPFSDALAYLTYFSESAAAVCLVFGLFTRVAAAMIAVEMLVVVFVFQWSYGYFWTNRGFEFPLLLALLCIGIFCRGGGRHSIDHLIGKEF